MRTLFITLAYLTLFGLGLAVPFVMVLGYVWTDIFRPQAIAWSFLTTFPVAFAMGLAAFLTYFLLDRRAPPRLGAVTMLTLAFAGWATLTCFWAEVPAQAWWKWDWAVKSILFGAFIPYVIRSRNQIEAFIQVVLFSVGAHIIPFGLKTIIGGGGGYGINLGILSGNSFLAEGATLSAVCAMSIPLLLFLRRHSRIIALSRMVRFGYLGLAGLCFAAAIGTHERTALIGFVVVGVFGWMHARRKVLVGAALAVAALVGVVQAANTTWGERMGTIANYEQDSSAYTRILVWQATLEYVSRNPFGGGFEAYRINRIVHPPDEQGEIQIENGRAYHSIYFEVLGETGWPGLGIFVSIILVTFRSLRRLRKLTKDVPNFEWIYDLSGALQSSLAAYLACGAFAGIAFQPFVYYLFALSFALTEYRRRAVAAGGTAPAAAATAPTNSPLGSQPVPQP